MAPGAVRTWGGLDAPAGLSWVAIGLMVPTIVVVGPLHRSRLPERADNRTCSKGIILAAGRHPHGLPAGMPAHRLAGALAPRTRTKLRSTAVGLLSSLPVPALGIANAVLAGGGSTSTYAFHICLGFRLVATLEKSKTRSKPGGPRHGFRSSDVGEKLGPPAMEGSTRRPSKDGLRGNVSTLRSFGDAGPERHRPQATGCPPQAPQSWTVMWRRASPATCNYPSTTDARRGCRFSRAFCLPHGRGRAGIWVRHPTTSA